MAIQAATSVPASPGADLASPPRAGVGVVQMPISSFGSLPDADADDKDELMAIRTGDQLTLLAWKNVNEMTIFTRSLSMTWDCPRVCETGGRNVCG